MKFLWRHSDRGGEKNGSAAPLPHLARNMLVPPTPELIDHTGIDRETLRCRCALPQPSKDPRSAYLLVVSDPTVVAVDEFRARGIALATAAAEDISSLWAESNRARTEETSQFTRTQAFIALSQLAVDAARLGASEVFIGHPSESYYEFIGNNRRYGGRAHESLYPTLLGLLRLEGVLEDRVDLRPLTGIRAALTRSYDRAVVCLTWTLEQQLPPKAPLSAPLRRQEPAAPRSGRPCALVIDDDDRFCLILRKVLEEKGFVVERQSNGDEALHWLTAADPAPDIIICDVHMPVMDGTHFLRALRERDKNTPVLILTSDTDELLEAELAVLGCDAFVRKQEDPRILLAWCRNLLGHQSEARVIYH